MLVCRGFTENLDQKQMTIRAGCGRPRKEAQLREDYGVPTLGTRGAVGTSMRCSKSGRPICTEPEQNTVPSTHCLCLSASLPTERGLWRLPI